MTRAGRRGTVLFVLLALAATIIAARARYSADLSAFLPEHPDATQRALIEQLRSGPATRLIIAAIRGGNATTRAELSTQLAQALRASPQFQNVSNGDAATLERDRAFLFAHRYLLSEAVTAQRFSVAGLHEAIAASLEGLASPEGPLLKPLFAADPTGELMGILDSFGSERAPRTTQGVWSTRDGAAALLLLQTRAAGADTEAQQAAGESVRQAFTRARAALAPAEGAALTLTLSGPPVFAVAARKLIIHEVVRLSTLSGALVALLLLCVYRSLPALLLGLVPVGAGALAGVAAVALGFPAVHGVTLGFGVTLIGEAVDYSIYLFVQGRGAPERDWRRTVWPTLRLGALTSIVGFAALWPSSFQGLAQLGLYSVAGLGAAALVTRYVLPAWIPAHLALSDLQRPGTWLLGTLGHLRAVRYLLPAVLLLSAAVLYAHRGALLNRELSSLSPVPLALQQLDERLHADLGAPDVRFILALTSPSRDAALEATQHLATQLAPLTDAGTIGGLEYAARYLPSSATQQARRAALPPAPELRARLTAALAGLPVDAAVLGPFVDAVDAARRAPPLSEADLAGTSFATAVDTLLRPAAEGYNAFMAIAFLASGDLSPAALQAVRSAVRQAQTPVVLLDLKEETDRLYANYLTQAIRLSLAGFAAIVLLLALALRSVARVTRVLAPLVLAVASVAALLIALGQPLTILHLVGLLLTVAVGSNYALFFDRSAQGTDAGSLPLTLSSLVIANLATVVTFAVLASSSLPMLSDLGAAVAPGALLALLFSAMLSRPAVGEGR